MNFLRFLWQLLTRPSWIEQEEERQRQLFRELARIARDGQ